MLASQLVTRFTARRVRGDSLILAYHGIVPSSAGETVGAGERALYVRQRDFAAQLDMLSAVADVVPLARLDEAQPARPRVAITFDDAYHGAVTVAVEELVARNLPATIFVAPGRLNGHVFWWDALGDATRELDPRVRDHALTELAGADERVRAWANETRIVARDNLPPYARASSIADLLQAAKRPGITIGSHTWSHPNLTRLSRDELAKELSDSLAWVRAQFGSSALPWLAYPYGLESPAVRDAAATAGYVAGVRIDGGWHRGALRAPFARPRLNVGSGMSVYGLRARVLGAWPA